MDPAQVQAIVDNLQGALGRIGQLEAQLAAQAAAPPPPVPPADTRAPRLKAPTPELFTYPARDVNVDAWHFSLDNYFSLQPAHNDAAKIIYAGSLMRKGAAAWYRATYPNPAAIADTWDGFKLNMRTEFQIISPTREARDRLAACTQRGSVAAYISAFRSIAVEIADLSAAEKFDRFVRGLKPNVQREVDLRAVADFDTAALVAERYDAHTYRTETRSARPSYRYAGNGQGNGRDYGQGNGRERAQPMELDALQGPRPRLPPPVSPGTVRPEVPKHLDGVVQGPRAKAGLKDLLDREHRCYYCRQVNCSTRTCPWRILDTKYRDEGRGKPNADRSKNR